MKLYIFTVLLSLLVSIPTFLILLNDDKKFPEQPYILTWGFPILWVYLCFIPYWNVCLIIFQITFIIYVVFNSIDDKNTFRGNNSKEPQPLRYGMAKMLNSVDWFERFYPISAIDLVQKDPSDAELIQHSLTKWIGILPENLKLYGVLINGRMLLNSQRSWLLEINSESCTLCVKYYDTSKEHGDSCVECPFYKYYGETCDSNRRSSKVNPYHDSLKGSNVMVTMLDELLQREIKNE